MSGFGSLGFNDENQFPRNFFHTNTLGSGIQPIVSGAVRVHSFIFTAGAAGGTLILRGAGTASGTEYDRIKVLVGDSKVVPVGFFAASGLEALTTTAGGDFSLTVRWI